MLFNTKWMDENLTDAKRFQSEERPYDLFFIIFFSLHSIQKNADQPTERTNEEIRIQTGVEWLRDTTNDEKYADEIAV